jgi:PAS domain S-box-containing protein
VDVVTEFDPVPPEAAPSDAVASSPVAGPEDALADVMPNAAMGERVPSRALALLLPSALVAIVTFGVAEWTWWLHPGGVASPALAPAAGVLLAVLLLVPRVLWLGPALSAALGVALAAGLHDAPAELVVGDAAAVVLAGVLAAVLLQWYANGRFHLTRVRELCTLGAAAVLGSIVGAAVETLALAAARDLSADALWRAAWPLAIATAIGMVLVPSAVLTLTWRPGAHREPGRVEGVLLALAVAGVAVAFARTDDPAVFAGAAVLVWAAMRFGPAAVAWSGILLVGTADWAAARLTGPFTDVATVHDAVVRLEVYAAVVLFGMLALALALDERDAAEAGRLNASERFRRTFHDSPVAMAVTTVDGRILETNRALCQLVAMADHALVGTDLRALRPDDSGELELWRVGVDSPIPQETRLVNARGNVVWVEISETPLRRPDADIPLQVVVLRDVTERTNLRQQLFQAQKMESVARLAGGIAHDFNNVLSVMRGQVELLQDDLEILESARKRVDSVQRATDRAAALTDDLMAFSRKRVDEPEPFDVHERLLDVQELFHQVLGSLVTLQLDLQANPSTIVGDPNRIEQSLLNLVVNARDAMPAGGCVTIATRTDAVTRQLVLSVTDTGAGMDAATRARIFEPFFTTKPAGFGTGLGLSTTEDIVRAAGGTIEVDSDRGKGTTFTLTFPALEDRTGEIYDFAADDDARSVLVVDDESEVRGLIAEILGGAGYHVVVATDGDAAVSLLERTTRPFDLLVTDVVMPVMSGTDLAARVTSASPSTRVLFVSGFVPAGSPSLRGAPLVAKPLHRAELLEAVHLALDGATDQGTKR